MNASVSHALTVEHVLTSSADLLAHALRNIQEYIVKKMLMNAKIRHAKMEGHASTL